MRYSGNIRRHRGRRRPRRHRGRAGRGAHGLPHAAGHAEHRGARPDELQPGDRRHRQGPPGQGDRRARRRDGARHRPRRHPVPHAERQQGPGGARDARAGRPRSSTSAPSAACSRTSRTSRCSSRRSPTCGSRAAAWPASSRRPASSSRRRAVVLTVGTFLGGRIHVGLEQYAGRPRRRSAVEPPRREAARAAVPRRPAQDRHAAAHRRPQHRLHRPAGAARRRAGAGVLVSSACAPSTRARCCCHITATNERTHELIRAGDRPLADVHRRHRGRRPALLPVGRGQGRALRRQGLAPDLHRARGPRHARGLPERHLDQPAVRRAARIRAQHPRLRARAHHAARLRDRVRLLRSARPAAHARDAARRRACTSPARSTAPRATRKRPRRASSPASTRRCAVQRARAVVAAPQRGLHRRAGRRPDHARRARAVPHVHQPRRVPPDCCARTTPTCASRPVGRELGLVDDERWRFFERKRVAVDAELQRLQQAWVRPGTEAGARAEARFGAAVARAARARPAAAARGVATQRCAEVVGEDAPRPGATTNGWPRRCRCRWTCRRSTAATSSGSTRRSSASAATRRRRLPDDFDYAAVRGLSNEVRQRLAEHRPGHARPGRAHPGHHARGRLAAAHPPEAARRRAGRAARAPPEDPDPMRMPTAASALRLLAIAALVRPARGLRWRQAGVHGARRRQARRGGRPDHAAPGQRPRARHARSAARAHRRGVQHPARPVRGPDRDRPGRRRGAGGRRVLDRQRRRPRVHVPPARRACAGRTAIR